jgi:hypothetical protein
LKEKMVGVGHDPDALRTAVRNYFETGGGRLGNYAPNCART